METPQNIWGILVNHWFEILLALAVIISVLRILALMWSNPQGIAQAAKALFSGAWADIQVSVLIALISVAVGFGFIYKRLDTPYTALLWAIGCLAIGWLVGFLFGIPKVLQSDAAASAQQAATSNASQGASAARNQTRAIQLQVNTNLEQISDWLTKIIVGLGLMNLRQLPDHMNRLAHFMAPAMGDDLQIFAAALFLYFSVVGFLGGYITTRLWLAGAFSRADAGLLINHEDRVAIQAGDLSSIENPKVSDEGIKAASKVATQSLDQLTDPKDIALWAKAQLTLGEYDKAIAGYAKAIELAPNDIELHLEYASALYYAKRPATQVRDQLMQAYKIMKSTPNVSQDIKRKVYRAITYHFRFQPPPEGFTKAIEYGEEYVNDPANQPIMSGALWVNLAVAYAQKAKWLTENKENVADFETQFKQARDSALNAVRKAIQIDSTWKEKLAELLKDGNELDIFKNDNEFREAVGLAPIPPQTITPPPTPPPPIEPPPTGETGKTELQEP
jgi:tetratricopeptide (TPR) repeat protein